MMNRCFWYGPLLVSLAWMTWKATRELHASELAVSPSGRYLTVKNQPCFWLGDTVWRLAQVPSRDELELHLRTRAEQGFTVIQPTAVMGEERVWGTSRRATRGKVPFVENDGLKPAVTSGHDPADPTQYDYWEHLDYVLERIHAHGGRAALVTYFVGWQGEGYEFLNLSNAQAYGPFLGARFCGKSEIIWVLGGDNTPKTDNEKAVWPLVSEGLTEGLTDKEDYSQLLMTYHATPMGTAMSGTSTPASPSWPRPGRKRFVRQEPPRSGIAKPSSPKSVGRDLSLTLASLSRMRAAVVRAM